MNRIDRLLGTILLLQSYRVVTAEQVAAHFEISVRTVYRDFVLISLTLDNGASHLKGGGPPNQELRILVSNDLANWSEAGSMSSGPKGLFEWLETLVPSESRRFYRVVSP